MENVCSIGTCPLSQISWTWYIISVLAVFAVGMFWYSVLFAKAWKKATCECGADLSKGEACTCQCHSMLPLVIQFVCTCLLGLMYFVLMIYGSYPLSLVVAVVISGWMKASLKFKIGNWKRYFTLAGIEVGYFFVASLLFMLFAGLH